MPSPPGQSQRFVFLLRYAHPYRRAIVTQFSLMALSTAFGLLKPWPMKVLIDNVVGGAPLQLLGWHSQLGWQVLLLMACLAYLLFNGGEALIQVGAGAISTLTCSRMIRDLRSDLLHKLQQLSLRFHDAHKVGDLVHRVTWNSTSVETAFQSGFMGTVKSVVMLVSMFIVMLLINVPLTAVSLIVVPLLLVSIRRYARRTHTLSFEHQNQEGKVSSTLQEILASIRLVKAYDRVEYEQRRFDDVVDSSVQTRLRSTLVQKNFGFWTATILAIGTAILFYVGISQVKANELTIGEFLVFVSYLAMLYSPLSVLSYTASSVQSALGSAERLFEILNAEDDVPEGPNAAPVNSFDNILALQAVTFGYESSRPVLQDVTLQIPAGRTIAIVGETGCGKSTLLSLLLRFYDPWKGAVLLDGADLRSLRVADLRRLLGYVPQDQLLLSGSIRDNIAYARPDAPQEDVVAAARAAEAHDFIMETSQGYDSLVGERGVRLSMGQRQRICIARAFLKDAPILLMDEPTSALDAETESRILDRLCRSAGKTIVIVAHRLSTIRDADQIVVMRAGRIVEQGSHEELLAAGRAYARLWNAQVGGFHLDREGVP